MQTLYVLLKAMLKNAKREITIIFVFIICVSSTSMLSACGTLQNIHVDHTTHTAAPENACAKAYRIAQKNQHAIDRDAKHATIEVWKDAAKNWKTVAQQCPGRLSESIVYSAQAQWAMLENESSQDKNSITQQTQQEEYDSYIQLREVLDHYENFRWTHQPLAQAAAAEDKLAFILQTLAAKKVPEISLKYSDIAATNAESLMHASAKGTDLRKKVYDIPQKVLESGIIHDSTSKKDLPLAAFAYINCARGELAAFQQTITINEINQNKTSENNDVSAVSNKSSTNTNNPKGKNSNNNNAVLANQAFKNAIVNLITSRLLRAYALGYPADVSLLFSK